MSARDVCPSLHEALDVHLIHGPCPSWPSGRRQPALGAPLGRSSGRRGPCRGRPEKEVPIDERTGRFLKEEGDAGSGFSSRHARVERGAERAQRAVELRGAIIGPEGEIGVKITNSFSEQWIVVSRVGWGIPTSHWVQRKYICTTSPAGF